MSPDTPPAPRFFLYGETPRRADEGFLHIEPLHARSRPSGWSIRPHLHGDLAHLFLITAGGGAITMGGEAGEFRAPCLLLVPRDVVHGFTWVRDSAGLVLTLAESFLRRQVGAHGPELPALFERPHVLDCAEVIEELQAVFARLQRELAWRAPGSRVAVEACVLNILVAALRLEQHALAPPAEAGRGGALLLARFREEVEHRFRDHQGVEAYARSLGVGASRLRQVCQALAGQSPLQLIQRRLGLEAERALIYSDLQIADIAFTLGFEDVAYFSRFFSKHAGVSPRQFRRARRSEIGEGGGGSTMRSAQIP